MSVHTEVADHTRYVVMNGDTITDGKGGHAFAYRDNITGGFVS
jgi:hypothetical protein